MVFINKRKGETKDALFRKFTRMFIEENVVDDVRKKMFYKKPSLLRKEKEKERKTMGRSGRSRMMGGFSRFGRSGSSRKPIQRTHTRP